MNNIMQSPIYNAINAISFWSNDGKLPVYLVQCNHYGTNRISFYCSDQDDSPHTSDDVALFKITPKKHIKQQL